MSTSNSAGPERPRKVVVPKLEIVSNPLTHQFLERADLSYVLDEAFPANFGGTGLSLSLRMRSVSDGLNVICWTLGEHVGKHLDAPLHSSPNELDLASIPVDKRVVTLVVIDVSSKSEMNPGYQLLPSDIQRWNESYGPLPSKCCVAMRIRWSKLVGLYEYRGEGAAGLNFPGFHPETSEMLLEEESVAGLAVDRLSLHYGMTKKFETHTIWVSKGRWGIVAVKLDETIPKSGSLLFVGSLKVRKASGGQIRPIAIVSDVALPTHG